MVAMEIHKASVQTNTLLLQDAHTHFYPCITKFLDAQAIDLGKGVLTAHHHPRYLLLHDEVGTRRSLAVVSTGFQAHVYSTLLELFGGFHTAYGIYLGMRSSTADMISFAYDMPLTYYHCSHHGIRSCTFSATTSQLNATLHV